MESGTGCAKYLQCPYHGWTYGLDGQLNGTPQFGGAKDFDKKDNGLVPIRVDTWEKWIFVCLDDEAEPLNQYLGSLPDQLAPFRLDKLVFHKTVIYDLDCNWKVFVDNYLDGGYHVPILHGDLSGVLDCRDYSISIKDRYCLQDCPTSNTGDELSVVRSGDRAYYYWYYPNLMINLYEGVMDTNLVVPLAANRCRVYFDYYFGDDPKYSDAFKEKSVEVAHRVQIEDEAICRSVQRGLASRAYDTGRLSPEKEAGEHLFHRLLYQDLKAGRECITAR
jgi:choline monooxygenase